MNKRKISLLGIDILIIVLVYLFVWGLLSRLRSSSLVFSYGFGPLKLVFLIVFLIGGRLVAKVYSSIWRYANENTYIRLILSDLIMEFLYILQGQFLSVGYLGLGYSLLTFQFIILATVLSRFVYQLYYAKRNKRKEDSLEVPEQMKASHPIHKIDIAIVGAGNVGAALAAEFQRNPNSHYEPYCFFDKDLKKIGQRINGLLVYPEDQNLLKRIHQMPIQEVVIALPNLSPERKEYLYNLYRQTGCTVKIYDFLPSEESAEGGAQLERMRDFRIEDLLFRSSVDLGNSLFRHFYEGKTVLVTGGGGSIGSELCRQIAANNPKRLIILDIYENNAYEIQQELIRRYGHKLNLEVVIASVRDKNRLEDIFRRERPQLVFHAAAHKHVPLMESSGVEALKNNVLGTYNTANMAEKYGAEKFLLISSDKAVNPTNVMGASKRLCEMAVQCRRDSRTAFCAVRFGNVLGSNGSVVPLFKKQIEAGGPITLTDKRIIRYFMTIPEAVQLVMEAGAMAKNGELFVLDMGKPVRILDLAENMIRLSGYKPYKDIDIVEIGLRPGEKLYEELLMNTDGLDKTGNNMIFVEHNDGLSREAFEEKLEILRSAIADGGQEAVRGAIRKTVPTFELPETVNARATQAKEMQLASTAEAPARKTILVVDDAALNRAILREILVEDYNILEAVDGASALELLSEKGVEISLVLLDINMPGIDGFEVLERMQQSALLPEIPVVVISAETEQQYIRRGYELGATEYLARPFDFVIVRQRVRNVLSMQPVRAAVQHA